MDYHLDWLTAALEITRLGLNASDIRFDSSTGVPPFERGPSGRINGTQEDVDLLVAFPSADTGRTVLVMIEAKSDTSWGTSQLTSKGERLRKILGEAENEWGEIVQPYFLLTSPREPEKLDYGVLPAWARLTKQWF
jgi:hypothetical protein